MNKKDWQFLDTLYKTKNISKAAEQLYITQPALTNRVRNLEEEFNVKILYRIKTGIQFTMEGEYLVDYSRQMLADYEEIKTQVLNLNNNQGYLKIGVSNHFALHKLSDILKAFLKVYPGIQIKVKTGVSSLVMKYLYEKQVHVAIESGNFQWSDQKKTIFTEKIYVAYNKPISFNKLPQTPMIGFKTNENLQREIDNWWLANFRKPPLKLMEIDSAITCINMVYNNFGYTIIPELSIINDNYLYKKPILLNDNTILTRNVWMKYNKSSLELEAVRKFISFMEWFAPKKGINHPNFT